MSLIEELKNTSDHSFDTWFDRWFEKNKFPAKFKQAAQQGYSGYYIELRRTTPLPEEDVYLNRRLRDPRTIVSLKERLPGITVTFIKEKKTGLFNIGYTVEKIHFSWK